MRIKVVDDRHWYPQGSVLLAFIAIASQIGHSHLEDKGDGNLKA